MLGDALARWDIRGDLSEAVQSFFRAAPSGVPSQRGFSQAERWDTLDLDRAAGCVRDGAHACP
jgi:dihydroxy-acid dehydratase